MKQIEFIKTVARALDELNEKAVFVGGATVPFYLPEDLRQHSRATDDVDVVLEVIRSVNRGELEANLRKKGFKHDMREGAPLCRWRLGSLSVDIMSPDDKVFGFSNKWYKAAIRYPLEFILENTRIRILSAPYFLATKIEAFKGRGKGDYLGSHDMEDIITMFDVASEDFLENAFPQVDSDLAAYLKKELSSLLNSREFKAALPGSVFDRQQTQARTDIVYQRVKDLVGLL